LLDTGFERKYSAIAMFTFDRAVRATRGAREYQEDTALVWPGDDPFQPGADVATLPDGGLLAILADGMGGHAGGALASRMACDYFVGAYTLPNGSQSNPLMNGLAAANEAIAAKVVENPLLQGMGSTLVAVSFAQEGIHWVSVGDSPLLLWRRGEIVQLNEDHSLAPDLDRLVAAGKITELQARRDPRRHMLRSAVTGEDIDLVDISRKPLTLERGDFVILASDGVQTLDNTEIERIVAGYGPDGAAAVAAALIRAIDALREPHQDNATVVVVRAG
jgi:PPM family protein phosphatase